MRGAAGHAEVAFNPVPPSGIAAPAEPTTILKSSRRERRLLRSADTILPRSRSLSFSPLVTRMESYHFVNRQGISFSNSTHVRVSQGRIHAYNDCDSFGIEDVVDCKLLIRSLAGSHRA